MNDSPNDYKRWERKDYLRNAIRLIDNPVLKAKLEALVAKETEAQHDTNRALETTRGEDGE